MALAEVKVAETTGDVLWMLRVVGLAEAEWLTMDFLLIAMVISLRKLDLNDYNDSE
jgi:hypothetical protein